MILTMCFTQFLTTRQLMTKNVDLTVKTPYMQQQKMMMYVFPVIYIFFGITMPVGVLIYMVTSNLWTLGQQLVYKYYSVQYPKRRVGCLGKGEIDLLMGSEYMLLTQTNYREKPVSRSTYFLIHQWIPYSGLIKVRDIMLHYQ